MSQGDEILQRARIFDVIGTHVRSLTTRHPGQSPSYTEDGCWQLDEDGWAPAWTPGFFAGLLWILAVAEPKAEWRGLAEAYSRQLERFATDPDNSHSIGFIFTPSWGRWNTVAPSEETRRVLIEAGRTMAASFNEAGKYLRTWVDPGSTFVDMLMTTELLYQAAELAGDQSLADIATAHALTTRRYLVRGDGSTVHEGWFDPSTGEFLRAATHQGARSDSTWARGQAWAIYGFGTACRWTDDMRFLDTAKRCADYYVETVGERFVAPNDLAETEPVLPYEASAAAIAASGMLQLSSLEDRATDYREYAVKIVKRLCTPEFLDTAGECDGIIKHATYHRGRGLGVDQSVIWGDYYFAEAVERLGK